MGTDGSGMGSTLSLTGSEAGTGACGKTKNELALSSRASEQVAHRLLNEFGRRCGQLLGARDGPSVSILLPKAPSTLNLSHLHALRLGLLRARLHRSLRVRSVLDRCRLRRVITVPTSAPCWISPHSIQLETPTSDGLSASTIGSTMEACDERALALLTGRSPGSASQATRLRSPAARSSFWEPRSTLARPRAGPLR